VDDPQFGDLAGNLFSIEKVIGLGDARYSAVEVTEKAGLDLEQTRRLWRAMGFVIIPDHEIYFTEADLDILMRLTAFMEAGFADLDLVLGVTRVMSQSIARITDAEVDAIRHRLAAVPGLLERIVALSDDQLKDDVVKPLEEFLVYVWRRQLAEALQRASVLTTQGDAASLAIGFADIVGFTRLSRELAENDLTRLIESFEASAQDAATEFGGRIVKTIGDEVMFVSDTARQAAEMSLQLAEAYASDEGPLQVRIGMALGEVIVHHGDYFGLTVNLANRSVGVARPGSVLVSEEFADALGDDARYEIKPIPRRRLKGIGTVQLYVLRLSAIDR
jgi:adenylate cyclase